MKDEKIYEHIIKMRESLINDLIERSKLDGFNPHIIREVVTRKFDELVGKE
jgi:hypothetical protein